MKFLFALTTTLFLFSFAATAQKTDRDSFEVGVDAYNAGNYEEALRIMKKYEKEQPSAAYVVQVSEMMINKKNGRGISYDIFMRDLIEKGDLSAFEKLGMIARFNGEISGFSGAMFVNSLQSSAQRGDVQATFRLGQLYQEGIGVPRNFAAAAKNFKAAANGGSAQAMNTLGLFYRFGIGVKKDEKTAERFYKKAILNKNLYALFNLGQMYADRQDFLQAYLLADLGLKRINPDTEKKNQLRLDGLKKKAAKNLTPFQSAYLEKYWPFWLKPILKPQDLAGRKAPKELPLPPPKMVEETPFMTFIKKDAFDNRYKVFFPLMPDWVAFNPSSAKNPELSDKKLLAPSPGDEKVTAALYFRPSDPRFINLTLNAKESAIPVMVGDTLTLSVYTPLYENAATLKGGHMYIKNTGYKTSVSDPNGIIGTDYSVVLTPLSSETARQEAWLSQRFIVRKVGSAIIRFDPQPTPDGKEMFPYTLKIIAIKGKLPK